MVDQDHLQLTPVPGVHQARSIHHTDTVTDGEAAPRNHEAGVALRNGNRDTRRNERPLTRFQAHIDARIQVEARVTRMRSSRCG
jgi:hypothetical protein